MSRTTSKAKALIGGLAAWLAGYLSWLGVTAFLTLGGALFLMGCGSFGTTVSERETTS